MQAFSETSISDATILNRQLFIHPEIAESANIAVVDIWHLVPLFMNGLVV